MKHALLLFVALGLTACATVDHVHPVSAEFEALQEDVRRLESTTAGLLEAVTAAQDTANAAQACCDANTERLERIFEQLQAK